MEAVLSNVLSSLIKLAGGHIMFSITMRHTIYSFTFTHYSETQLVNPQELRKTVMTKLCFNLIERKMS